MKTRPIPRPLPFRAPFPAPPPKNPWPEEQLELDLGPGKSAPDTLAKLGSLSRIAAALRSLEDEAREKDPKRLFRVAAKN